MVCWGYRCDLVVRKICRSADSENAKHGIGLVYLVALLHSFVAWVGMDMVLGIFDGRGMDSEIYA